MPSILSSPDLKDGINVIRQGLDRKETIIVVGSCTVNYKGRAKSSLSEGERIIILKPDGSLLVHKKLKRETVN